MAWSFKKFDVLSEEKFILWEKLLETRTGIQLVPQQKVLLQTQVAIRMRELGIDNYDDYYKHVQDENEGILEWQVLVDRLVVKETTFFRHRASLDYVRQYLKNKIQQQSLDNNSFNLWSVGCSTGEEPYSLAMVANDCLQYTDERVYFGVNAIDVSLPALSIARNGVYGARSTAFLTDEEKQRYFRPYEDNRYQVLPRLKKRVCFSQANILNLSKVPVRDMDVIFCQNVLIYFRRWRRREVLNHLASCLKPGGLLVIGLGETTDWQHSSMQRVVNDEVQAYVKGA